MKKIPIIVLILGMNLMFAQGDLTAVKVGSGPVVDGLVDTAWNGATALTIPLGETYDVYDPASITDCGGCHAYNSDVLVTTKAVYTDDMIYFLTQWPDPTASFTRGNSWYWDASIQTDNKWNRNHHTEQSEDRMSFFFPIGEITGNPYSTGGCMSKCHMYYPTDNDPHVSSHGIVDDAWLESGRGDMWHSKAARGGAYLSAVGTGLTIDPVTFEVTAGTFSMTGYADDKYVDVWADDATNSEDGGRYGDAGTSAYSHNRISDKSRPKYIEMAPTDYTDAMILTQNEIDGNECAGDPTTGVTDAEAATYWPAYVILNAVVPERILRQPDGSRSDIKFGAVWNDGMWTAEFGRSLNTGSDDDVQFVSTETYLFNVAAFENSRHGYEHRTSDTYTLAFEQVTVGVESELIMPNAFKLHQNFPNPFNPSTRISFSLTSAQIVNLSVYDLLGREVVNLVNEELPVGVHSISWHGTSSNGEMVESGVYFAKLTTGDQVQSVKMLFMK